MTTSDDLWFENAAMGQKTRLVTLPGETGGRSFATEVVTRPFAGRYAVPAHFHPAATETFEILAGRARYIVGRIEGTAGPGDRVVMPPGLAHVHPWSDSDEELRVRQTAVVEPADLRGANASLQALVTICGLAGAGKVNRKGLPSLLQLAVLVQESMPATYLASPPVFVQRLLFGILSRLGRALGYRTGYPRYGVLTERGFEVDRHEA